MMQSNTMQALDRILAIIESVSRSPEGAPPARVAEETGLSLSTVVRLMQSLHDEDVLLRSNTSGHYRIGTRLVAVVGRATRSFEVRAAAAPILEQLRDTSNGETAAVHVRTKNLRVCVAAAYTTHAFGRIVPVGLPLPLPGSSVGHVLLAQMDDKQVKQAVASLGLGAKVSRELLSRIESIRQDGYAVSVDDSVEGVRGVAVPVGNVGMGALSVSGPSNRLLEKHVPRVLERLHHAAGLFEEAGLQLNLVYPM